MSKLKEKLKIFNKKIFPDSDEELIKILKLNTIRGIEYKNI